MSARFRHQKCSICGKNEALIFVELRMESKTEEKGLCAECAIKFMDNKDQIQKLEFIDKSVLDALDEMRKLLTSIVTNISVINTLIQTKNNSGQKCTNCGLTYENFKESGYFGCSYCYQSFHDNISEIFFEIERGSSHKGKMPKKYAQLFLLKKEIHFLKSQLKKSVLNENYEQAQKLKKKLDKLIGGRPVGKEDEIY